MNQADTTQITASDYLIKGKEYQQQGNINRAIESYQKSTELNPNYFLAWSKLAAIYEQQKNWAETAKCYQRIITLKPRNFVTYPKLAKAFKKQNKIDEAIAVYEKVIKIKPDNPKYYQNIAELYFDKNDLDGVIDSYQKAIELEPDLPFDVYKKLGQALKLQGREKELDTWLKLIPEQQEGIIYAQIWSDLNKTDFKELINNKSSYPTQISQKQVEQYFAKNNNYKTINLTSLTKNDKQFLKSKGLSLAYLNLNQVGSINRESSVEVISNQLKEFKKIKDTDTKPLLTRRKKISFQDSVIKEGCISIICPHTGKVISSNKSLFTQGMNMYFYRFVGSEVFYLITSKVWGAKYALYFPTSELIIGLQSGVKLADIKRISSWKAYIVRCWDKIYSYMARDDQPKTVVVVKWHSNIGHQVWNNLTGLHRLVEAGNLHEKVEKFLILGSKYEYYGSLNEIFPEILPEKIKRIEKSEKIDEQIWKNNYFVLKIGDIFIEEDLAKRICLASWQKCSPHTKTKVEKAKQNYFPLLFVTIRLNNRTWVNQVEGLANIIKSLSEQFPTLGVVFDGCCRPEIEGNLVVDEKLEATINNEKETVRQIQSLLPEKVIVYDIVGSTIYESIVWANSSDLYLAHFGANLSRPLWVANKPGVVHSNKLVYEKPLPERVFSWERENTVVPIYVPEEHIVNVTEGFKRKSLADTRYHLSNYDCDWKVIYQEVLKLAMSIERK